MAPSYVNGFLTCGLGLFSDYNAFYLRTLWNFPELIGPEIYKWKLYFGLSIRYIYKKIITERKYCNWTELSSSLIQSKLQITWLRVVQFDKKEQHKEHLSDQCSRTLRLRKFQFFCFCVTTVAKPTTSCGYFCGLKAWWPIFHHAWRQQEASVASYFFDNCS